MTRPLRVTRVATIILLIAISPSLVFAQTINDPTAQSSIHASHIASNFASEIVPGINNYDLNTKKNYYLIGSIGRGYGNGKTANLTTPIVANKTRIIPVVTNVTAPAPVNKINPIQPVTNINNTTSITINIYHLSSIIINDTKQKISDNGTEAFQSIPKGKGTTSASQIAQGGWPDTNLGSRGNSIDTNNKDSPVTKGNEPATTTSKAENAISQVRGW